MDSKDDVSTRRRVYSTTDGYALYESYEPYLIENGYTLSKEKSSENIYIYYLPEVLDGVPGYFTVTVIVSEDTLKVLQNGVESLDEL